MEKGPKALVAAAKAFAKKKNGGVSARMRAMLDDLKPGLAILVTEKLSITDMQEFCKNQGLRVSISVLRQYCQENFNYPPRKPTTKAKAASK